MSNGNPFYVHPGADLGPGLQGLAQTLMESTKMRQAEEEKKQKAERYAAAKTAAMQAFQSQDPAKIAEVSLEYPEISQALNQSFSNMAGMKKADAERERQEYVDAAKNFLTNPTEETVQAYIDEKKDVMPAGLDGAIERFRQDPQGFRSMVEMDVAGLDPKGFKAMREAVAPDLSRLTNTQKDYERAQADGFTGTFIEYQKALSKDPSQDLEMLKLRAQIADIEDRIQNRQTKADEAKQLKTKKDRDLVTGIDSVTEEIDKAIMQVEQSPSATGLMGAVTGIVPGTPAYNLRRTVDTVKANLGFDKLQAMRDASPTGGALGQVSERELNFLQSTITALDPNMGDEELTAGLEKVKRHYNNWRKTVMGQIPEDYERHTAAPTQAALDYLIANPQYRDQFVEKYGESALPEGI